MKNKYSSVLFSSACLPPVEYFIYLVNSDKIRIENFETYHKQTYRNRYSIYGANGKLTLSIPVIKSSGHNTCIKDIKISYLQNWQNIHWKSIESAYNSSPYFLFYRDELFPFFDKKSNFLIEYNHRILELLMELTGIKKEVNYTTDFQKSPLNTVDLRNKISPKNKISSINFEPYHQVFENKSGFIPNLSIIDLLFNEGPNTKDLLRLGA